MNGLGQAALVYAARFHWAVLPTGGATGKVPHTDHGVKDATTDPVVIRRWWEQWPQANVGLACGAVSGFWVLDVDGEEGVATLTDLEGRFGTLPKTIRQLTPSGGLHILFRYDPTHPLRNRVRFLPGLDIRGDAGFIVAAPSRVEAKARPWAWDVDAHPTESGLASAPPWLLEAVVNRWTLGNDGAPTRPKWLQTALGEVPEGRRNDIAARLTGHLLRRYVEPRLAADLVSAWNQTHCRPPLPDNEFQRIVESIAGRELRRRQRETTA
jgi:bifunctional DNA primase/polymerase-like protein/primase-like protein